MVKKYMIKNFPINISDVTNSHTMFGQNLAGAKRKSVRQIPDRVVTDYVDLPREFSKWHKFVTLVADAMFANGAPLLTTMSRGVKFMTVKYVITSMDN